MYTSQHSEFILTPLMNILKDGLTACKAIGDGIESYPMGEYLMQSLFLKLTGAQEQKMKCICWDMATLDYEYRYDLLNNKRYGECSTYESKNGIFKDLISIIKKDNPPFAPSLLINDQFISEFQEQINAIYSNSVLSVWKNREYSFFKSKYKSVFNSKQLQYATKDESCQLFQSTLQTDYKKFVYKHRNQCAHNTMSYQINKSDLAVLSGPDFGRQSYFFRFALIILIDEIFIKLFNEYLSLQQ